MAGKFARVALLLGALLGSSLAPPVARPAEAIIYHGPPDLALVVSLIETGTGPSGAFSSHLLFSRMFGKNSGAENLALQERYGFYQEADYFGILDYVVGDVEHIIKREHITLPPPDSTASASPHALAVRLYALGFTPKGKYDVGYMVERLATHSLHHVVMHDIDKHFMPARNESFHIVLTQVVRDAARGGPG
jgi:hypothetical protein